jgi:hypothetical protein
MGIGHKSLIKKATLTSSSLYVLTKVLRANTVVAKLVTDAYKGKIMPIDQITPVRRARKINGADFSELLDKPDRDAKSFWHSVNGMKLLARLGVIGGFQSPELIKLIGRTWGSSRKRLALVLLEPLLYN